ncbi:MAG: 50S ribosomal protein L4 [Candidatus Aenigmatarchaeota archaeon]
MTKANVYDMNGKVKNQIELPKVFLTEARKDLVLRAFLSLVSKSRRKHSRDPMAGKRTSAHYHGRRSVFNSMANKEMARGPRITGQGYLNMRLRFAPHAVKGRLAHPPLERKVFLEKINDKERKLAIQSAIAATANKDAVSKRGHKLSVIELPIIVDDGLQKISKTSDVEKFFIALGLKDELKRIAEKTIRAGKGKGRGRKYKMKTGPLIVVGKNEGIAKAAANIEGVDVTDIVNINAKLLAPGGTQGRLTVWTESAIKKLAEAK